MSCPYAAAVVLAGGRSSRMGTSKAALEWHGSTLLRHVTGIVGRAVDGPVVVARAPGQALPALPSGIEVVDDEVEGAGPMQGLVTGLHAVGDRAPAAFVCSVDLPLLHPAFVTAVLGLLDDDADGVQPVVDGHPQPLTAAYRTAIVPHLRALIAAGRTSPAADLTELRLRRPDAATLLTDPALAAADPLLQSLTNVNRPGEYAHARALPAPLVTVVGPAGRVQVRAATRGAAAAAVGSRVADPDDPLVAGDVVEVS